MVALQTIIELAIHYPLMAFLYKQNETGSNLLSDAI